LDLGLFLVAAALELVEAVVAPALPPDQQLLFDLK
jgi:hypothetical protein